MAKNELTEGLKKSLKEETIASIAPILDGGIACLTDIAILSKIPFISTVNNFYHLGKSIKDYYDYKKLYKFIESVNTNNLTEEEIEQHISNFNDSEKELEYIVIMLDRQSEVDQSDLLGKLYVSYIRGRINWIEFRQYANVIDRLLPGDIEKLYEFHFKEPIELDTKVIESSILRLQGLGLIISYLDDNEVIDENVIFATSNEAYYKETAFANKFVECIK